MAMGCYHKAVRIEEQLGEARTQLVTQLEAERAEALKTVDIPMLLYLDEVR